MQRYEIIGRVATTRTGAVWKARDVALDRPVALKQIPIVDRDATYREAAALAAVDSPHVVAVYGVEEDGPTAYLVQEWVDGATLAAVLRTHGRLATKHALGVIRGALLGLAAAHAAGLVHGDVSLSNILVGADGTSRLIDFGSVVAVGATAGAATGAFAAPEVRAGLTVTPAADVYAAAAVLAVLLHGRIEAAPSTGGIEPGLRVVLDAALADDPRGRYDDAGALLAALEDAARRSYGAEWWTQAGLGALAVAATTALVPVVAALAGSGAVAGSGSTGVSLASSQTAGAQLARSTAWHGRRLWWAVGGGAVAVGIAITAAVAASSSSGPSTQAQKTLAPSVSTSGPTAASPSGTGPTTSIPTVGNQPPPPNTTTSTAQVPLRASASRIDWTVRSACAGCPVSARAGSFAVTQNTAGSRRDADGSYSVTASAPGNVTVLSMSGTFRSGLDLHVSKGAQIGSLAPGGLYFYVVMTTQPAAGVDTEADFGATGSPATADCTLVITKATTSALDGSIDCSNVVSKDGKYTFDVRITVQFDR